MEQNKTTNKEIKIETNKMPITSPISPGKLVSKVNALTSNLKTNQIQSPQNLVFNTEKNSSLNYKQIVDELITLSEIDNINDYYNKIYSMISQNIDSSFFAIGLFKDQSNCINLRLQDKLGNNYSTKVFLKDDENPIVKVFKTRKPQFTEKENYLRLAYFKDYSTAILPLISVNKCIGVFIIEDSNAQQSAKLYSLISSHIALVTHNLELLEKSEEYIHTDSLTLLNNHRGFQEI